MIVVISASLNSFIYLTIPTLIFAELVEVVWWKKMLAALLGAPEIAFYLRWMFSNNEASRLTYLYA